MKEAESLFKLKGYSVKKAIESGVKLAINTDAHTTDQLNLMEYGVYTARRGWARKKDIVNTHSLKQLKRFLMWTLF